MLFLKIRVDVEEKTRKKVSIVNFFEHFRFFLPGLVFITFPFFVFQKDDRSLKKCFNFKLNFVLFFSI